MRVICTRTGPCHQNPLLGVRSCAGATGCAFHTRISEPIEVEDVDWREEYKRLSDWCGLQEDEVVELERLRDSLIAAFEELAGELRFWQESGLYPLGISPGPGWYWVKGHWRSRTAPEARASQAPTGDKDGEPGESQARSSDAVGPHPRYGLTGIGNAIRTVPTGITLWACEVCGKPTDTYPCRMCGGVPLSPEAAELVRQGLEDCAEGRVSEVPSEVFRDGVTVWYCEGCGKPTDRYPCRVCGCVPTSDDVVTDSPAVCRWEVGRWGI